MGKASMVETSNSSSSPQTPESPIPPTSQVKHLRLAWLDRVGKATLFIGWGSLFIALVVLSWTAFIPETTSLPEAVANAASRSQTNPITINQTSDVVKTGPLVGIISGHAGYDPGAVCPDGLTEAEINQAVALAVGKRLTQHGIRVNLLEEFDDRLPGYEANVLVSIHADSCNIPGATGFKAARSAVSGIPEIEDQLVSCLITEYAQTTRLPEHPNSVTHDMLHYHVFRDIALETPAAIIELGFMLDDRALLEHQPDLLASGIENGILCFLESQKEPLHD